MNTILEKFKGQRVLIIGDVMVDSYINGKMDRISPEAPVPVVSVTGREERLGGAANVALNIQSLGGIPRLCAVIGNDQIGERFMSLLVKSRINPEGVFMADGRKTSVKHRVMVGNHHVIRIDEETEMELSSESNLKLQSYVGELIEDCDIVIIEDYDKGLLNPVSIEFIIKQAKSRNKPVIVDPKKKNFHLYKEVALFKPNFKELQEGLGLKIDVRNKDMVKEAVIQLQEQLKADRVMVTLSDQGIMIFGPSDKEVIHIPAHYREISDVSGAGDTVVAIAALALGSGAENKEIAEIANLAGGLVCEHHGVVPIEKDQLTKELERLK